MSAVTLEAIQQQILDLNLIVVKALTATKETLDFEETASYINQSPSYLYKLTSQGLIPRYKPNGKKLYFKRTELDEWMLRNKVYSADELEEKVADHLVNDSK